MGCGALGHQTPEFALDMVQGGNLQNLNLETRVKVESRDHDEGGGPPQAEQTAGATGTEQEACLLPV